MPTLAPSLARAVTMDEAYAVAETTAGKVRGMNVGGVKRFLGVRYGADTARTSAPPSALRATSSRATPLRPGPWLWEKLQDAKT
jgi:carboxylesterase type B